MTEVKKNTRNPWGSRYGRKPVDEPLTVDVAESSKNISEEHDSPFEVLHLRVLFDPPGKVTLWVVLHHNVHVVVVSLITLWTGTIQGC